MTAQELYLEARKRGLRLEPRGDRLAVIPAKLVAPAFANVLREHKRQLLDWLETRTIQLTLDQVPWLHIARQVLAGEFDGADGSTTESLTIGLQSIAHPLCQQALRRLKEVSHEHQS